MVTEPPKMHLGFIPVHLFYDPDGEYRRDFLGAVVETAFRVLFPQKGKVMLKPTTGPGQNAKDLIPVGPPQGND